MKKSGENIHASLKIYAKKLKISDIGVCKARIYNELEDILCMYDTPFVAPSDKRISPFDFVKNARSVIMCVFNYYCDGNSDSNLSRYAWGLDYHDIVKSKLSNLCSLLKNDYGLFEHYIFCDNSPMCDKYLAYLSGLGIIGENHLLIHPKFGSYIFIGGIITDLDISEDKPLLGKCAQCGNCKKYCPGKALDNGFNANKCASYILQKKGDLSAEEINIIANSKKVWGCDVCSEVCVHNLHPINTDIEQFYTKRHSIEENDLINDKEFNKSFSNRAFSWRGYKTIKRNYDIIKMHK